MERIIGSFIHEVLEAGCHSWDIVVDKVTSLILRQSLDCRSGEIGRSSLYTGSEFLAWKPITITLDEPPLFENLPGRSDRVRERLEV